MTNARRPIGTSQKGGNGVIYSPLDSSIPHVIPYEARWRAGSPPFYPAGLHMGLGSAMVALTRWA